MKTFSNSNHVYIGREAGKEIHEKIRNAKSSVKIVSPYLSADYLKDLITLHKKGIKVTLITCDKIQNSPYSDFRKSDLIKEEKIKDEKAVKMRKFLFYSFIFSIVISIIMIIPYFLVSFTIIPTIIAFSLSIISLFAYFLILDYSFKYTPIFRIKVFDSASVKKPGSTELIHSKIFVIDEETAFLGSANFTYSGFKTHYETVIKITDKNAVRDISEEVEKLYSSTDLRVKDAGEW